MLDPQGGQCRGPDDIVRIVRGQVATEDALARQANRVLICDTDVLTGTIWSDVLFDDTPVWIRQLADARNYDLYLLCDVDVPWVDDNQRFFGEEKVRREMFERFRSSLESRGRKYQIVRGDWSQRFATARDAVAALLV
jgi:nicotinamide riboside kinase